MTHKYLLRYVRETYIVIITFVLWLIIALINENFAKPSFIVELLGNNGVYYVCALGILPLMIMHHIDLSVSGVMLVSSMIVSMILNVITLPLWLVLVVSICAGGLAGYLNGRIISQFQVSSVIVTLATLSLYRGISRFWFRQNTGGSLQSELFGSGLKNILGIPAQVFMILAVALATGYLLKYHTVGRRIYALGENEKNASRLGFDKGKVTMVVYTYSGMIAGVAAFIHMSLLGSSNIEAYNGIEFDLIIILIIGGLNILGGYGTVHGTFFAATFVIILESGLIFARIPVFWHNMVIGVIILITISYDMVKKRLDSRENSIRGGRLNV